VIWGDGTALLQTRNCDCDENLENCVWSPASDQQSCTVVIGEDLAENCDGGGSGECAWSPWTCIDGCPPGGLSDCVPLETPYDCETLGAAL
jgi:hypothetical protein